jgi:hypothetical protein
LPGVFLLGTARASVPTPFGGHATRTGRGNGGDHVPANGVQMPLLVPDVPSLCGTTFQVQAALGDPGASHGVAFTRGLELGLGA